MPYLPSQSTITEEERPLMSENNSKCKRAYKVPKSKNNRAPMRMKAKESSEQNMDTANFVNLKIGETLDLNPPSALKRSRRLEGRQDIDKSKDDFVSHHNKSPITTSDQLMTKKVVSKISSFTPPAKQNETRNKEKQKNAECGTHSLEKPKR